MANTQSSQAFYSLTLEAGSAPTAACLCNVIPGLKATDQQIFEARGERVYLRRLVVTETEVKVETVLEQDVFSIIRGVGSFKIPGTDKDLLAISSDSGRMVMLEYNAERNRLDKVHLETFGKSQIRRMVPGQYLAVDPKGRCLMLSSVEKNKVSYIFQRNPDGEINISSPHEANQSSLLCFDLCAVDTGWEHPVFAALEVDYSLVENEPSKADAPPKHLNYYTVDLGLNHVAKSWSGPCDPTANKLFTVPGGQEGPSGVIICAEGRLYWMHKGQKSPMSIPIPQRQGALEQARNRYIVSGCMFSNRSKRSFFLLLQTDDGDVFKLTMDMQLDDRGRVTNKVEAMNLRYFDTLPLARQMLLIKKGYLYIVAESGPSKMFHVDGLAEDDEFEPWNSFSSSTLADHHTPLEPLSFKPRAELHNLSESVEVEGLHPLTRTDVDNLTGEDMPQIYAIQGKGDQSMFRSIRHGMSVEDIVSSDMGNVPYDQVWSMKKAVDDQYHHYILLSSAYTERTTVLGIGDEVETLEDTAFLTSRATITAAQMGEDSHVQVHARGVRTIRANGTVAEWKSPAHRTIVTAAANQRQLLLGLSSGELVFFFMDQNGELNELEEYPEMSDRVTAIGIGATPRGQQQAKYGVIGCEDRTIRVLSTDLETPLEPRSVQALSDVPTSIEVVEMIDPSSNSAVNFVHIGLKSGLYLRAIIDEATGELSDVRSKFLGHKPVRIFPVEVEGQQCVLCCSSRPWLGFHHPVTKQFTMTPLVTGPLTAASPFVTEHISGVCGIMETELRIFTAPRLGGRFVYNNIPLEYTPRNFTRNPWHAMYYVIESDANTLSKATINEVLGTKMEEDKAVPQIGLPSAPSHWASCIQAIDPVNEGVGVTSTIYLEDNEAALCCACVPFESRDYEVFLAVGTGQDMNVSGKPSAYESRGGGFLHIYKLLDNGTRLEFVHKTRFNEPVRAILPFKGRLAVGIGSELFIYDIATKAMLRKTRGARVPNTIVTINAAGDRLVCGDVAESLTYIVYKPKANRMITFVDDTVKRWTTAAAMIDYETAAGGDKFGNLWVLRCPPQASEEADEDGMNGFIVNERPYLGGAPYRLENRAHFFVNDVPTSIKRTPLVAGGQDVIFWSGISGTMGIMVPFVSREDVAFFQNLEQALRTEDPPLTGRDHLMYRGYYAPVKGVIDGDLCERYMALGYDGKARIAAELDREPKEVEKKVTEMRTRVAF